MINRQDQQETEEIEETLESAIIAFLRKLFKAFNIQCTFEEFLRKTSEYLDKIILTKERRNNLDYVGGKISFNLNVKGDYVKMSSKLYFRNEAEEWIVQESSNNVKKTRFSDWDKDEDLKKIEAGETLELDIIHPEH